MITNWRTYLFNYIVRDLIIELQTSRRSWHEKLLQRVRRRLVMSAMSFQRARIARSSVLLDWDLTVLTRSEKMARSSLSS